MTTIFQLLTAEDGVFLHTLLEYMSHKSSQTKQVLTHGFHLATSYVHVFRLNWKPILDRSSIPIRSLFQSGSSVPTSIRNGAQLTLWYDLLTEYYGRRSCYSYLFFFPSFFQKRGIWNSIDVFLRGHYDNIVRYLAGTNLYPDIVVTYSNALSQLQGVIPTADPCALVFKK